MRALAQLAVSSDGRRGATLDVDGLLRVYDLEAGERLCELVGACPTVALSPTGDRVCSADGVVYSVPDGEVLERSPIHGPVFFVGEALLQLGRGRARLSAPEGGWDVDLELDPSPRLRLVRRGGSVALFDPCMDSPAVLELASGRLHRFPDGPGPVHGGTWDESGLVSVQGTALLAWDADTGALMAESRPFAWQTLAVVSTGGTRAVLGLHDERRAAVVLAGPPSIEVPIESPLPELPELHGAPWGVLVETRDGCAAVRHQGGTAHLLALPPRRGQERSIDAHRGRLPCVGAGVFLGSTPPTVYDPFSGRIRHRLEPWSESDLPEDARPDG